LAFISKKARLEKKFIEIYRIPKNQFCNFA